MEIAGLLNLLIPLLLGGVLLFVLASFGKGQIVSAATGAAVCILVIATVLVPVLSDSGDSEDVWEYDDYRPAINVNSASGAFELIEVGDSPYLHAKSLGEGTITYSNGNTSTITVEKANLDIFMIAGQSNSQYNVVSGDLANVSPAPHLGEGYYYGSESHALAVGNISQARAFDPDLYNIYDMCDSNGVNRTASLDGPFAADWYLATHHKTLVINCGVGGTSITYWGVGEECYLFAKSAVNDALNKLDTSNYNLSPIGVIWVQGEANTSSAVEDYKTNFTSLHAAIADGSFNSVFITDKCAISLTRNGANSNIAQYWIVDHIEGTFIGFSSANSFTVDNGMLRSDGVHYTQLAKNQIAKSMCDAYLKRT